MANPNNCTTCKYFDMRSPDPVEESLHCYMFRDEPVERCMQHTGLMEEEDRLRNALALIGKVLASSKATPKGKPHETTSPTGRGCGNCAICRCPKD